MTTATGGMEKVTSAYLDQPYQLGMALCSTILHFSKREPGARALVL